jgi:co-chaperonin GroES (HSP10)
MNRDSIRALRPLRNQIVVEVPFPVERTLPSGIILPAAARAREQNTADALEGTVVAVGRGRMVGSRFVEVRARVGDRVLFPNFSGEQIRTSMGGDDKHDYFRIYDDEVLGTVEGEGDITGVVSA